MLQLATTHKQKTQNFKPKIENFSKELVSAKERKEPLEILDTENRGIKVKA